MEGENANGTPSLGPVARRQYAAVIKMRRQMLVHSLRSTRGRFELAARIFWMCFLALVCLGVSTGCWAIAHELASDNQLQLLPLLLWPVMLMWQAVPLLLASAQENVEFNFLLRFPVSFRSYLLLYLAFGIFDPASLLGGIALLGVWLGVTMVVPWLGLWLACALATFAVFNFLLTRTIFAWIERWLAKRRTREALGMAFVMVFLVFQLFNPAWRDTRNHPLPDRTKLLHAAQVVKTIQSPLPPGLTARSIELAGQHREAQAMLPFGGVLLYVAAVGVLLSLRLRAEYRGESLGEAPVAAQKRPNESSSFATDLNTEPRWPWFDTPVIAVFVKELRYLLRSGVMLFGLFAPLVLLFAAGGRLSVQHNPVTQYAFPLAVAYGFLPLTRQVCNSLGAEETGIQLYFLSPTPFRTVMLAKNLLQTVLFLLQLALICAIVVSKYGSPSPRLVVATFSWLAFALPANLAAGNILSISMAYKMTTARLSREKGSVGNGLLSLLIQLVIFLTGLAIYLPLVITGHQVFAAPILLLLAAGAVFIWMRTLANVDPMAANRRESLIAAVVRAA